MTPPLKETFQAGLRDYNAAKYSVATGEFQDVIHYYPMDDLAGSAQFYLGEIAYRQQDYAEAIKNYNAVLEDFSGNAKAPAAQLHKGFALISARQERCGSPRTSPADSASPADARGLPGARQAHRDGGAQHQRVPALISIKTRIAPIQVPVCPRAIGFSAVHRSCISVAIPAPPIRYLSERALLPSAADLN